MALKFSGGNAIPLANKQELLTAAAALKDAGQKLRSAQDVFARNGPYNSMANELRVLVQKIENWGKIAESDAKGR